jgi:hypothetical protein
MGTLARSVLALGVLVGWALSGAAAQEKDEEKKPPTFREEQRLFAYVENSYTVNLTGSGRGATNELRLFDYDEGYTFNIAEFSLKKDPSETYPFGYGLVVTAGIDSQKLHAIGIFRDEDDAFPFRNTRKYDLQEAYVAGRIPVGNGLTLKAGKWVTLLGYEVIESPNNLNFSRSFLFTFAIPLTHVGALATYPVTDWLGVSAGPVLGWDVADDTNGKLSWTGQIAVTPRKDLTASFQWITGPEQPDQGERRTVFDLVVNYTGIKALTLGLNVDYGREEDEPSLVDAGTRRTAEATWWGWAAYAAYDWTEQLRAALRLEYFQDSAGVRTLAVGAGSKVSLYSVTATLQYRIWRGLVGRLEYRHDQADEKAFKIRTPGLVPTSTTLDTVSVSLHYLFF